ncbi:hypothetical protein [Massilia phosphatilytica]
MAWRDEKYADLSNEGKKEWLSAPTGQGISSTDRQQRGRRKPLFAQRTGRGWTMAVQEAISRTRSRTIRTHPPQSAIEHSFEYETGLTRSQQEHSTKILRKLGILSERRFRLDSVASNT